MVTQNRIVSLVNSTIRPVLFMIHLVCSPSTVSPICRQSHTSASQFMPMALTLNARPSPQLASHPMKTGSTPARLNSGTRSMSPCTCTKAGSASERHRHARRYVANDTRNASMAITTLATGALAFSASMTFLSSSNRVRSTSIYSSFLRWKGLVCAITSLSPRRKEPNRPYESRSSEMSVTVKRVDRKSSQRFYELIVETAEVTVRVPFNGYELDDLEKQIDRCFNEED